MAFLPEHHPRVAMEFENSNFTVRKTSKLFSYSTIDQALKQNNAIVKGDIGDIGLTEDPFQTNAWYLDQKTVD